MGKLAVLVCLTTLLLPLSLFPQQQSQALTNKDVLDMLKAGLTPEIVIAKIKSSTCNFDTSPDALKALKAANVPDAVILAVVQAPVASKAPAASERVLRIASITCINVTEVPIFPSPEASSAIASPKCGEKIAVLDEQGSWDKVRTEGGKVGYISHWSVSEGGQGSRQASVTTTTVPSNPSSSLSTTLSPNVLRAVAWRAVPWVTTSYYQQPGSANTDCTGSGTWFGNIWQGNSSCTTQYTPAQNVPMNWYHYTVYNLVETADSWLVVACTRNWAFSKCSYLIPGNLFPFEYKKGKIAVTGHKAGKDKEQSLDFDIVSSQPKS